jgi:putative FmdB family regulatory protein
MPLYEYRCPTCRATFELLRPMRRAEEAVACPAGHEGATRVVSLVAARGWTANGGSAPANAGGGCACGGACSCAP